MAFEKFDRSRILQGPLGERKNKVRIAESFVRTDAPDFEIASTQKEALEAVARRILDARSGGRSVMLTFGAHSIKNGLGPLMVEYLRRGFLTHVATNGAGIIHDWEFAFLGQSSESVRDNLPLGRFGTWEETGFYLNVAIAAGAYQGLGYGAAVGKAICDEGIMIPSVEELFVAVSSSSDLRRAASALDFAEVIRRGSLEPGWLPMKVPYAKYSLQAGAYALGTASTDHPMFGHDIIYTHHLNCGGAIAQAAEYDYRTFLRSFSGLDGGGVYLSLGSAVMSPMLFSKACAAMAPGFSGAHVCVVDIGEVAKMPLFSQGSPASLEFLQMDNRAFLLNLYHVLIEMSGK